MFLTLYSAGISQQFRDFANAPIGAPLVATFPPNARDSSGETVLQALIIHCQPPSSFKEKLEFLIRRGEDINQMCDFQQSMTPVQYAMCNNNLLAAWCILRTNRVDLCKLSKGGFASLHFAVFGTGSLPLIRSLVEVFHMDPFQKYERLWQDDPDDPFEVGTKYSAFDVANIVQRLDLNNVDEVLRDFFRELQQTQIPEIISYFNQCKRYFPNPEFRYSEEDNVKRFAVTMFAALFLTHAASGNAVDDQYFDLLSFLSGV